MAPPHKAQCGSRLRCKPLPSCLCDHFRASERWGLPWTPDCYSTRRKIQSRVRDHTKLGNVYLPSCTRLLLRLRRVRELPAEIGWQPPL